LVKVIAGKIIPAISTTNNFFRMWLYIISNLYINERKLWNQRFENNIFNFIIHIFIISQPIKVNIIKNKEGNDSTVEIKVAYDYKV
jgi:hypothetical protein